MKSPWLRAAFDYSHFQLRGIALRDAWNELARDTVFIHVKDSTGDLAKFQFVLPATGRSIMQSIFSCSLNPSTAVMCWLKSADSCMAVLITIQFAACKRSYAVAEKIKQAGFTRD